MSEATELCRHRAAQYRQNAKAVEDRVKSIEERIMQTEGADRRAFQQLALEDAYLARVLRGAASELDRALELGVPFKVLGEEES
jgi:hypothetical protein